MRPNFITRRRINNDFYFLEENKIDIFDKLIIHHNKKFMDQIKSINFYKKEQIYVNRISKEHHKFRLFIIVVNIIFQLRLERDKIILTAHIKHVVNSPINLPYSSSWVEQPLNHIHQHRTRTY